MVRPAVTSAYLAQQAIQAAAPSSLFSLAAADGAGKGSEEMDVVEYDDGSDDESEDGDLVEERFLDPNSKEGIDVRIRGYSQAISPLGRELLRRDREILKRATKFTEVLDGSYVVIKVMRGEEVLHSIRHGLNSHERAYVSRWLAGNPLPMMPRRTIHDRDTVPRTVPSRPTPARVEAPEAEYDSDSTDSSLPDLVDASGRVDNSTRRAPNALSISSGVLHPHTLPLSAPPPPRRRRSTSSAEEPSLALPVGSPPPFADLPVTSSSAADTAAREELVQLYHFTAASELRDSTALGRLLDGVAEAARAGRGGRDVPLTVLPRRVTEDGVAMVFDVIQQEEVEEEVVEEEEDEPLSARRETVGR